MTLLHNNLQVRLPLASLKRKKTLTKVITKMWETKSLQSNLMPDSVEKYIKASDFIKALIEARK